MQKITPFLWFNGNAEEAMNFYVSVFKNSKIVSLMRVGDAGQVLGGTFQLDGQDFQALNGGPEYSFTPAISLFVSCETQEEIDELWAKLSADKNEERCGWLKDKFGLSWQIVPTALGELMQQKDPNKAQRVMDALLKMGKIDIQTLRRAAEPA